MDRGAGHSTGLAPGATAPMEVAAAQDVTHFGAGPKQLVFGPPDSGNIHSPMKGPPPRVTVDQPTNSPDMPQPTLVKEVHRLFEQGKVDTAFSRYLERL